MCTAMLFRFSLTGLHGPIALDVLMVVRALAQHLQHRVPTEQPALDSDVDEGPLFRGCSVHEFRHLCVAKMGHERSRESRGSHEVGEGTLAICLDACDAAIGEYSGGSR